MGAKEAMAMRVKVEYFLSSMRFCGGLTECLISLPALMRLGKKLSSIKQSGVKNAKEIGFIHLKGEFRLNRPV